MKQRNRKAQAETIAFVLISMIVMILILVAFTWGRGILEERKESYVVSRMQDKMLEIRDSVMSVVQEGTNATRVIGLSLDRGKLYLDTSFIPIVCGQVRWDNSVIFETETTEEIFASEAWLLIDPYENETGDLCVVGGPSKSYPAVLFGRSLGQGEKGKYTTQYLLSFRNLKDISTGDEHIIRIGTSDIGQDSSGIGEGQHSIMIRNEGSSFDIVNSRWTHNAALIFDP